MSPSRTDRDRVRRLVAALAAGDERRVFDLVDEYGDRLRAVVARHLRSFGRADVLASADDVAYLVTSAAFVVAERAASWDPDGALPWTWADRAIRSAVARDIGHATLPFDESFTDTLAAPHTPSPPRSGFAIAAETQRFRTQNGGGAGLGDGMEEVRALARHDARLALLVEAIDRVGTPHQRAVHVQYRLQKGLGDPAPARTIGRLAGLKPDNVRQIDRRMRVRLRRLAETVERFAPLLDLAWLDDGSAPGHADPAHRAEPTARRSDPTAA